MNQRRQSSAINPIVLLTIVGLVLAAAVYWFVIRDDSKDTKGKDGAVATKTFTAPGNSFSFKYPAGFAEKTDESKGYVFIGSLGAYDLLNVKRTANKPTGIARLKVSVPKSWSKIAGTTILSQGTDRRDGIDMVTIRVQSTLNGLPLTSDLYYFSANGVTWTLECESQNQTAAINAACQQALATFKAS
ncbi:hypothetical protein [Nocardioides marmorisolisilvae]|uniref:Uncharacterized protein n=1 Tax=Nocardioides marmorisolisilvae TaxID=1542737 RepID=A0A3N0DNP1_9ACTN|nr:hypothetical protein [Nocardioides marmorisolisilvae]RNL77269.1 hypothetical protein EFL95_17545 [Nocardioides marmorisolisilvae]